MFRSDIDVITALKTIMVDSWTGLWILPVSLAAFVFTGALMLAFSLSRTQPLTFRAIARYVFPPEFFRSSHSRVDLILFILNEIVWGPLLSLCAMILVGIDVHGLLVHYLGAHPAVLHASWAIFTSQFLTAYLSGEFAYYLVHRLMHAYPLMWSTHRPHHSAELLTFLTSGRNHPLERVLLMIFTSCIGGITTGALLYGTGGVWHPALPAAFLASGIVTSIMDKYHHSHLPVSFGPLNHVFLSGHMHQIHHSAELEHRDKNFGLTLSLFDLIFGTLYIPRADEKCRFGLCESEIGNNNPHKRVRDVYLEPFSYAWRALTKRRGITE
jgi:sterol desaturase/sphingolipid hydroxylase (fatty acid hydroxylase superfamily)